MGWAGGSGIAEEIWDLVRDYIPKKHKKKIARDIIEIFEYQDCDTITEAERLCEDAGYEYDEDEDEWVYR